MTPEQKAKRFDEALERARIWKDKSGMPKDRQGILDDIFPELKESEDEKIRKELIDYHRSMAAQADDYVHEAWIAWLEKQGKQSSCESDKEEMMFMCMI